MQQPKSTVLNLIRTLEAGGFLLKDTDAQTYSLGYKLMEHNYCLRTSISVIRDAVPLLEDIQISTGMIVYLTTHVNGKVLYLEGIYPSKRIAFHSTSGKTLPMHCTSCGKAMLAYMDESRVRAIMEQWGMEARTPNTFTDVEALLEDLKEVRCRGYAVDNEEECPGIRCLAVPVRNRNGFPTAAISISGSATEWKPSMQEEYSGLLLKASFALGEQASLFPGNREEFR
jgi:DNA-binding IclR family transcriptional regulator